MILAFDIGNTSIGCAVFEGETAVASWRIPTDPQIAWEAYATLVEESASSNGIDGAALTGGMTSSVVRGMGPKLIQAVHSLWGLTCTEVIPSMDLGIEVAVSRPELIGVDRLLSAGAAFRLSKGAAITVGLGTAITADLVSRSGHFLGGTISAGVRTSLWSLANRTSLLPQVEPEAPKSILGTGTVDAIQAGVLYGAAGAVDRLVQELSQASKEDPEVFVTGGDADLVSPYLQSRHQVESDLVLRGLAWVSSNSS